MKKLLLIIIAITLLTITVCVFYLQKNDKSIDLSNVDIFSTDEFKQEIEAFQIDKKVGKIYNRNDAITEAKYLWKNEYSSDSKAKGIWESELGSDKNENMYEVSYDSKNENWHINSPFNPNKLGGMFHAIINKNGNVVAIWVDE